MILEEGTMSFDSASGEFSPPIGGGIIGAQASCARQPSGNIHIDVSVNESNELIISSQSTELHQIVGPIDITLTMWY